MTTLDLSAVIATVTQSKIAVRTSREMCDTSQECLVQGHRALAATRANLAQMQAALAAFRRDLP
ncbi:hypothetical protein [uncultured Tateyamaria sp.]|uniref:hypothetical protein n=1 Tax=uncultured Tateyamaria sp. TaxID=455651 RepID=UPI0026186B3B|nr:hypothetical protein [uncultured Tateyamaria sp.]